ncbi:hypothetical protein WK27_05755 [Burkholderia vietnamiensis]|nr:hypothetical protein WK27_05755 [Burkholderia vietnamiensis]
MISLGWKPRAEIVISQILSPVSFAQQAQGCDRALIIDRECIMEERTARTILKQTDGHIDWNDARDCPAWYLSKIYLDGRFTADELRAIIEFQRKVG